MNIDFYIGADSDVHNRTFGGFRMMGFLARVMGHYDEQLGHMDLRVILKKGGASSTLTAAVSTLAINRLYEESPEEVVKSISVKCVTEEPEWA